MTGITIAALALALGLIRRPSPVSTRLRVLQGRLRVPFHRPTLPRLGAGAPAAAIGGAAVLGVWAWLGFGVAVPLLPATAGAVAGATAAAVFSRAAADRARRQADAVLTEAVGGLAADLRAGQQPAEALAALGTGEATRHRSVAAVWSVSHRSGAPAAAVLDRVEQDLRARQAQRRDVAAALAGARSTGALLAVLPLLGIGLGAGIGARPLAVLLGQPRGQLALVVGVVLEAVGVLWTSRIVAAAEGVR